VCWSGRGVSLCGISINGLSFVSPLPTLPSCGLIFTAADLFVWFDCPDFAVSVLKKRRPLPSVNHRSSWWLILASGINVISKGPFLTSYRYYVPDCVSLGLIFWKKSSHHFKAHIALNCVLGSFLLRSIGLFFRASGFYPLRSCLGIFWPSLWRLRLSLNSAINYRWAIFSSLPSHLYRNTKVMGIGFADSLPLGRYSCASWPDFRVLRWGACLNLLSKNLTVSMPGLALVLFGVYSRF